MEEDIYNEKPPSLFYKSHQGVDEILARIRSVEDVHYASVDVIRGVHYA